jgi:hypothetical protein
MIDGEMAMEGVKKVHTNRQMARNGMIPHICEQYSQRNAATGEAQ